MNNVANLYYYISKRKGGEITHKNEFKTNTHIYDTLKFLFSGVSFDPKKNGIRK